MRIIALPGVFRPRSDSWMLAHLVARDRQVPGADVLDLCTGSGVIALSAARAGAAAVTAVDVSRRSVATVRLNGLLNGVRIGVLRGDLLDAVDGRRFDVIASNPPYLPSEDADLPTRGPQRAWEGGLDGRLLLDRIIDAAPGHLRPGGVLWLVHSSVCGTGETLARLRDAGLDAVVAESRRGPLGPLLGARAGELAARGLLEPGQNEEEVVAIRATAPSQVAAVSRPHAGRAPR